jgi:hypothetical protein
MKSNRSRRLRKKLYLEEFAILGFEVSCDLNLDNEEGFDVLLNEFLGFLDSRELCMGGGGNTNSFGAFICSDHRYGSASNDDKEAVVAWLGSNKAVSNVVAGELVDANYAPE